MALVTAIIPNYNSKDYIRICIDSLKKQTIADEIEIVIVDNASMDGSREIIQQEYPEIRLKCLSENFGFCRAANEGITMSRTPYVLLINDDTESDPALVENMVKTIEQSERIFSVAAKMIQYDRRDLLDGAGDNYCSLGWAFARGKDKNVKRYSKQQDVFAACGGCALYRKSILEEIGYFDEFHFAYLEDVDMGYRARIMGYRNVYCPTALVYHVGSAATGSRYNDFKVRMSARNNMYIVFKNMPALQIIINLPFLVVGFGIKAIFFVLKGYGRAYLSGIKRGYLLCHDGRKTHYDSRNLKNYLAIQVDLWLGMVKRLADFI